MVFNTDFHGFSMASMDFQSFSLGWTHDHRTPNGHCGHLSGCWASVISHWWDTFIRSQICKKHIFISLRQSRRPFLGLRCAALPPPAPHQCSDISTSGRYALTAAPFYSPSARSRNSIASSMARSTTKSSSSNSSKPTANSQQPSQQAQQHRRDPGGNRARDLLDMGVVLVVVVLVLVLVVGWGGGLFLGHERIRPIDTISSSLGHTSNSALQTSHPSPSRTPLDTPARPEDMICII